MQYIILAQLPTMGEWMIHANWTVCAAASRSRSFNQAVLQTPSEPFLQPPQNFIERLILVAIDPALAAIFGQRVFGENLVGGFGRRLIRQTVADEDDVFATPPRFYQMARFVMSPIRCVAELALPSDLFIRTKLVRQDFEMGELVAGDEKVDDLMEAGAQDGQRNSLFSEPLREWRESGVDPNLFAQQSLGLDERLADAAHLGGDAFAQTQLALTDQPPDGFDHPRPAAHVRRQKDQCVRFGDRAVEVGEDMRFCHSVFTRSLALPVLLSVVSDFDARRSF